VAAVDLCPTFEIGGEPCGIVVALLRDLGAHRLLRATVSAGMFAVNDIDHRRDGPGRQIDGNKKGTAGTSQLLL